MLKFFRKIRQKLLVENRFNKYLVYAAGEIILVVIGILIALQINNWNEDKKEQNKVKSQLHNIVSDINQDIKETKIRINRIRIKTKYIEALADYLRKKELKDLNNLEFFYKAYDFYGYRPFTWYKNGIDELKSSGSLKSIKNDSIRLMINKYYALTDHLDIDYTEDNDVSEIIRNQLFSIVDTNYPRRENLIDTLFLSYRKNNPNIYFNSQVYKLAQKTDLKLITKDIRDIRVFINTLFRYKGALDIRYTSEFPRLIKLGETIIRLIEAEYQD